MRCISSIFAFFAGFNYARVAESPARAPPAAKSTDCSHGREATSDGVLDRLGAEDPYFGLRCSLSSAILCGTLQGKIRRERVTLPEKKNERRPALRIQYLVHFSDSKTRHHLVHLI